MVKLYKIYKMTSDINDLPDNVLPYCKECASRQMNRYLEEIEETDEKCYGCKN